MEHQIRFLPDGKVIYVPEDTTLLEAAIRAGLHPDAPCGGKGTCGKCLVDVKNGSKTGLYKACEFRICEDLKVEFKNTVVNHRILTQGKSREISLNPAVYQVNVTVEKCKKGESTSDWSRLAFAAGKTLMKDPCSFPVNLSIASNLYEVLNQYNYQVNLVLFENEIMDIRPKQASMYAVAFDIGTTTVVGYLLSLMDGAELAAVSRLNPQSEFGADVIGRSDYALLHGVAPLTEVIRTALNEMIIQLAEIAGILPEEIYLMTVVGNTCMHHLLLGISPASLVHAPYNAAVNEDLVLSSKEYGFPIHSMGRFLVLPNIAGFVGADTTGVMLASSFDCLIPLTLVIDIGTNGEMVLGNKDRMVACSTAAGPAFEGAKITHGMRGAKGAIDHVQFEGNQFSCSVIGGGKVKGICGSGLMDIVSELLKFGLLEVSGRLLAPDEVDLKVDAKIRNRLIQVEGGRAFVVAFAQETELGEPVFLTQKDIREVQLAKGAMAAGISLMAEHLGISIDEIEQVLIAGAFGNYMSPESACAIGLIPQVLKERIIPIGNAAGEGAKMAALSKDEFMRAASAAGRVEFLELAASPKFQDCFVDELEFPEQQIL